MPEITTHVKFDHVAREWRCKWSADNNKASLDAAQAKLDELTAELSALEGVVSVQRVVCGGCLDFKVVIKLTAGAFGKWEANNFKPEDEFLGTLKATPGISSVETQTYTLEYVKLVKKDAKKSVDKEKKAEAGGGKSGDKSKAAAPVDDAKQKLKKVIKEGGKRGVEIEGAADMGGLQFFCTSVDEPDGDVELVVESVKAMNAKSDPTEEERKGGSGHIGKMVFSAGAEQLAVVAYVPEPKQAEISCKEWLEAVLSTQPGWKVVSTGQDLCTGTIVTDADKGIYPLKIKEGLILEANNYLRKKGLFPDHDDDDDEMVFGDDDFPSA